MSLDRYTPRDLKELEAEMRAAVRDGPSETVVVGPATISVYTDPRETIVTVRAPVDWELGPRSRIFQSEAMARLAADRIVGRVLERVAEDTRSAFLASDAGHCWVERTAADTVKELCPDLKLGF